MYCKNCGKEISDESEFCEFCGSKQDEIKRKEERSVDESGYSKTKGEYAATDPIDYSVNSSSPNVQRNKNVNDDPMTVGEYLLTYIVLAIPIVGIIMIFVWAFGSDVNINKKNLCRALLILAIIGVVISILFSTIIGGILYDIFNNTTTRMY